MKKSAFLATAIALAAPIAAQAHTGHTHTDGFGYGLLHPIAGLDHLLAMLAFGLYAAQLGGRAMWALPAAFLGSMIVAAFAAVQGLEVPFIEPGIFASIVILAVLLALAIRVPLAVSVALAVLFGFVHGAAHGMEMPFSASGLAYGAGFAASTLALLVAGIGLGLGISHLASRQWLRATGAVTLVAAIALAL